jgi:RND family efflux transporter MFP subunit
MRVSGCALIALAAFALAGCGKGPEPRPEEVRAVRVLKVGGPALAEVLEFPGEVRPRYETRLGFRVGGKIVERLVETGSTVRAGQPIARLDPGDLQLGAAAAQAQVVLLEAEEKLARADLARFRELREKNFISQADFERRQSAFDTAAARLESARAQQRQAANQAGYAVLEADAAGVILGFDAEAGQVVAAGQTVARLARLGETEVALAVPEAQRDVVAKAGAFSVTLNALPGRSWQGRLRELSPVADPVTRTYAARVSVPQAGRDLDLGMSARVAVTTGARAGGIELPVAAIHGKGDATQVWLVDAGGTVRLQPVKVSGFAADRVVIEAGLKAGDVAVVAGAQLLRAGQKVRVYEERPSAGPRDGAAAPQPK